MSRRILCIAYNFPPAGGAGVQRPLKFIKYLPEFGWEAVVVTTTPGAYPIRDESLAADVPVDTPLYRVKSYDINALRPFLARRRLGSVLTATNTALMLPDAALLWAHLARPAVRQAIQEHRPILIYSSSPPASAHLLGLWARSEFSLPWVADFRDPWTTNPLTRYYPGYRAINRRLERRVLASADRILTVSRPLAAGFRALSGRSEASLVVIENGYDEDDVECLPPPQTKRFTLTYTGTFSRLRRPDALVAAMDQMLVEGAIPRDEIRVVMAGKDIAKYVPDRQPYELVGYQSHDALNRLRLESDLLLLVIDDGAQSLGTYSGKVFEHLGCNRPTLAITNPNNVAANLIQHTRAGTVVRPDPAEIYEAILAYYRRWQARRFDHAPDWDRIRRFTRRNLTARLAEELDQLVSAPQSRRQVQG